MGMSDNIASFILKILSEEDGEAEFSRVALAAQFECVPSQINYVLSTRFSPEHGYVVESRRGGGGYIRITRVKLEGAHLLMHIVNSVGSSIDLATVEAFVRNMTHSGLVSQREAALILASVGDAALKPVQPSDRDRLRANIFKQCLVNLA